MTTSIHLKNHLVKDYGLEAEPAIARARQTGLTKVGLEQRIRYFLDGKVNANAGN